MKADEWEQSRKLNHKEVERRRREAITAGINALAALLPPEIHAASPSSSGPIAATTATANKGLTLQRAVSYITELQLEQKRTIEQWTLEKLLMSQRVRELETERDAWR
ncbi:hypothetical protein RHOSPDRAFT_6327, partial [Rhodotorula sp. JG-1b]